MADAHLLSPGSQAVDLSAGEIRAAASRTGLPPQPGKSRRAGTQRSKEQIPSRQSEDSPEEEVTFIERR